MTIDGVTRATRRRFVKGTSILAAAAVTGPFVSRRGLASSGEVNFMGWAGYDFQPAFAAFEKSTGIKVNYTEQPDQDAMLAQAKAAGAGSYDLSEPTVDRVSNWVDQGYLQPLDEAKAGLSGVEPAFTSGMAGDMQSIAGQRFGSPSVWGTEALCFNKDEAPLEYGTASLADLWKPEVAGMVTVRPHSALAAIGRWLDAQGQLPAPFTDSYKDEATMTAVWDVALAKALETKASVAQFWKDENSAQGAFRTNGCVIGLNWDTTANVLIKEDLPIGYVAPKEGAFAWLENFVIFEGAKNVEQAYEFIKFISSPDGSALWATAYASNPVAKGAAAKMPAEAADFIGAAYPGDALERLWWWPIQSSWFITKRNEYADKYQAA